MGKLEREVVRRHASLFSVHGVVENHRYVSGLGGELAVGEEGAEKVLPAVGEGALQGERHLLVRHVEVDLKYVTFSFLVMAVHKYRVLESDKDNAAQE